MLSCLHAQRLKRSVAQPAKPVIHLFYCDRKQSLNDVLSNEQTEIANMSLRILNETTVRERSRIQDL